MILAGTVGMLRGGMLHHGAAAAPSCLSIAQHVMVQRIMGLPLSDLTSKKTTSRGRGKYPVVTG